MTDHQVLDRSLFLQGPVRPGDGGDHLDGTHRHWERFSRRGVGQVLQARGAMGRTYCR